MALETGRALTARAVARESVMRGSVSVLGRGNVGGAYRRAVIRISDMVEHQPQPRLRFVLCSETVIFVHRTEILEHLT